MSIDITNPGGNEAQLQAALRGLVGGWLPIASGVISSPQPTIDLLLPEGFIAFRLMCSGLSGDENFYPAYLLSQDEGATYIIDNVDFIAYKYYLEYHGGGSAAPDFEESSNSSGTLSGGWVNQGDKFSLTADIHPGETDSFATVSSFLWVAHTSLSYSRVQSIPEMTTGRMNAIRIGSADQWNEVPNDKNLISGAYSLLGIPAS